MAITYKVVALPDVYSAGQVKLRYFTGLLLRILSSMIVVVILDYDFIYALAPQ